MPYCCAMRSPPPEPSAEEKLLGDVVQLKGKAGRAQRDLAPQDHFIKACYDELVDLMGPVDTSLDLSGSPGTSVRNAAPAAPKVSG